MFLICYVIYEINRSITFTNMYIVSYNRREQNWGAEWKSGWSKLVLTGITCHTNGYRHGVPLQTDYLNLIDNYVYIKRFRLCLLYEKYRKNKGRGELEN